MTANTEDRVLTQKELAARWNMTPRTLQNWFNDGKGPKRVSLGNKIGYRLSDVAQYEEDHAEEPGTRSQPAKGTLTDTQRQAGVKARKPKTA
jgi:predicted DNA-binding transcriptional regulator AlpA